MIRLNKDQKLQLKLFVPTATAQVVSYVSYNNGSNGDSYTKVISNSELTDILIGPNTGMYSIDNILINNRDSATSKVSLYFKNGNITINPLNIELNPGDQLTYTDANSWRVIDKYGNLKQIITNVIINISVAVVSFVINAGEAIGGQRVIMISGGTAFHFDPTVEANAGLQLGISNNAASIGDPVTVYVEGVITDIGWGLTPDAIYYADVNGLLTTTPPTTGISIRVGVAIDSDNLLINFGEPLILT